MPTITQWLEELHRFYEEEANRAGGEENYREEEARHVTEVMKFLEAKREAQTQEAEGRAESAGSSIRPPIMRRFFATCAVPVVFGTTPTGQPTVTVRPKGVGSLTLIAVRTAPTEDGCSMIFTIRPPNTNSPELSKPLKVPIIEISLLSQTARVGGCQRNGLTFKRTRIEAVEGGHRIHFTVRPKELS